MILKEKKKEIKQTSDSAYNWFFTFMCMDIPLIGFIYLFYLAFNKKDRGRREFARAYILYKILFLIISAILLIMIAEIGLDVLDKVLEYMQML
ncbi:MAG: hypothetical protein IJO13_05010 [Lachnospiraceae bacterium]|nr:hypothetical protein [Lachnospiraceae bacterium]